VHPRGIQKNLLCKGEILKEFLVGGNAKHAHLAGGNDLFTFFLLKSSSWFLTAVRFIGQKGKLILKCLLFPLNQTGP
jgi:hypothetical protein